MLGFQKVASSPVRWPSGHPDRVWSQAYILRNYYNALLLPNVPALAQQVCVTPDNLCFKFMWVFRAPVSSVMLLQRWQGHNYVGGVFMRPVPDLGNVAKLRWAKFLKVKLYQQIEICDKFIFPTKEGKKLHILIFDHFLGRNFKFLNKGIKQ